MVLQRLGLGERLEAQYFMARGKAEVKNSKYEQYMRVRHHLCGPCESLFYVASLLGESRVGLGPLGWNLLGPLRALMAPEQRSKGAQTFLMQAESRISVDQAKISHIGARSLRTHLYGSIFGTGAKKNIFFEPCRRDRCAVDST